MPHHEPKKSGKAVRPPTPSQAEGDRETVERSLKEHEKKAKRHEDEFKDESPIANIPMP